MTATINQPDLGDRVPDPLPLCPLTELPRLLCGCGSEACDHFSMTEGEIAFLRGDGLLPDEPRKGLVLRSLPEYDSRPWSEPRDVKIVDSPNLCRVPHCTKPAQDWVCRHCLDDAEVALGNIPALLEDLRIRFARQDRMPPSPNRQQRRSEHTRWDDALRPVTTSGDEDQGRLLASKGYNRVPYVHAAGEMIATLENEVVSAVRMLCEHRGMAQPELDAPGASRWLLSHLPSIAVDVAGPDMVFGIVREAKRALRMIDRADDPVYLGLCDKCQTEMRSGSEDTEFRCPTCATEYVVEDRVEEVRDRVMGSLLSLKEIVDWSHSEPGHFGAKLKMKTLESWVNRGRLVRAGGRPNPKNPGRDTALYRAGDVLALVEERKAS